MQKKVLLLKIKGGIGGGGEGLAPLAHTSKSVVDRLYTYPYNFLVNSYIVIRVKLRFIIFTRTGYHTVIMFCSKRKR